MRRVIKVIVCLVDHCRAIRLLVVGQTLENGGVEREREREREGERERERMGKDVCVRRRRSIKRRWTGSSFGGERDRKRSSNFGRRASEALQISNVLTSSRTPAHAQKVFV